MNRKQQHHREHWLRRSHLIIHILYVILWNCGKYILDQSATSSMAFESHGKPHSDMFQSEKHVIFNMRRENKLKEGGADVSVSEKNVSRWALCACVFEKHALWKNTYSRVNERTKKCILWHHYLDWLHAQYKLIESTSWERRGRLEQCHTEYDYTMVENARCTLHCIGI